MGAQALAKIVQQGAIEAGIVPVKAQGILPIPAAPDRSGRLPISEPCDILHHHDQRQAPGGHVHGTALGGREIGQELILIKGAELRAQVPIEVAFGKGRPPCSSGRIGHRWERFRA
jgi:hypothetical protein